MKSILSILLFIFSTSAGASPFSLQDHVGVYWGICSSESSDGGGRWSGPSKLSIGDSINFTWTGPHGAKGEIMTEHSTSRPGPSGMFTRNLTLSSEADGTLTQNRVEGWDKTCANSYSRQVRIGQRNSKIYLYIYQAVSIYSAKDHGKDICTGSAQSYSCVYGL